MKSKKIVLFIVEGVTDRNSFALVLSKIIEKDKIVRFKVIHGDITTQNGVSASNIYAKITDYIKEFISSDMYKKSDISNVIHLVDTDGAFINDEQVLQKDTNGSIEYNTQNIYAKNTDNIKKRNKQKSQILSKLATTNMVYANLSYRVYFFSSNLEHVIHNIQVVNDDDKRRFAEKFEDEFITNPISFIEFMNNPEFAINAEYKDTWEFIKKDTNSLKRFTNFNLYLNDISEGKSPTSISGSNLS
ncbi:hypothetical protein [Clostridium estertheticum]|uniref:DUF4276 family protein n=1 Tax=Clostridium estertheticum subsp. estertheticum TaxID=1552 RepID=A0A1J0GDM4_9CLOT|nr:hypothetical protein [Clostridium estertheticum]APC39457.1 hypothetical protein A7L45_04950 [Clostridium estertheticum subsp. estertheticum]MBZ9614521.1 hypothetical protein [Clostridium estertheticum subsp. laramiense]WAG74449.1 hypothetical protein LL032_03040 [Clostridium estertheticum]